MELRQLGPSDLHLTPIGFGAWALGGAGWQFAWGPQDDEASIRAIHHALDLGVNWIDTAAVYGLGHSEEIVGRAVAEMPTARRPYIFTKCSLVWDDQGRLSHRLRGESIRREAESSLERLGVDCIDLLQIHWPRWHGTPPGADIGSLDEAWATLAALEQEGKVRHIGSSNFTVADLERVRAIAPIASEQPPYSLLRRAIEMELLPWCQLHHVGVIVYSPMQSGLLSGRMTKERVASLAADDWRRGSVEFQEPKLTRNLQIASKLEEIGRRHGRSAAETAIAWTLRHPAVTGAIVGARSPEQVDGTIGAATFRLSAAEIDEIEQFAANA
ncbi:MAG: aldo/keto reductase [Luteitalea sp.]|nr:aldo/keto reductase [Luteitalea sp.]